MTYAEFADRVDSGLVVDMVFLDFSMALDVSHFVILVKLQMLGIGGKLLLRVRDFLVGRTMCVKGAGEVSDPKAVTSRVSQESVLGPVLFLTCVICIAASLRYCWNAFLDDL